MQAAAFPGRIKILLSKVRTMLCIDFPTAHEASVSFLQPVTLPLDIRATSDNLLDSRLDLFVPLLQLLTLAPLLLRLP